MLKRILFCLCLAGLAQVNLPLPAYASQSVIMLDGGVDHLPQSVLNQLFKIAGNYYGMSHLDAATAYQKGELIMFETTGPNGEAAVMMDMDGNCLLSVIQDML